MREITKSFVLIVGLALPLMVLQANATPTASDTVKTEAKKQHKKQHKKHHMLRKMARFLDLSEQQKLQIKDIYQQARQDKSVLKQSRVAYQTQLQQLLSAKDFDEQAFETLRQTYASTFNDAALARAKTKHAVFQVLNEEQRKKLIEAKGKRKRLLH